MVVANIVAVNNRFIDGLDINPMKVYFESNLNKKTIVIAIELYHIKTHIGTHANISTFMYFPTDTLKLSQMFKTLSSKELITQSLFTNFSSIVITYDAHKQTTNGLNTIRKHNSFKL